MATRGIPHWPWLDHAADDLPGPERLLLDAARLWQQEVQAGRAPAPALRLLLARADAGAAEAPIDALLRLAHRAALPFGCRLCPAIHAAEGGFLLAIGLAQTGADRDSLAPWLCWMPLLSACQAVTHGRRISVALQEAGLVLCAPRRGRGPALRPKAPARMPPHSRPFVQCKNTVFPAAYPVISRNMD